jgi:hypothetical protein
MTTAIAILILASGVMAAADKDNAVVGTDGADLYGLQKGSIGVSFGGGTQIYGGAHPTIKWWNRHRFSKIGSSPKSVIAWPRL